MDRSKYLPVGWHIANKYEIIEVLGEDEFEILYLVRDIKRKGSFFVLKELFFETFSVREENFVSTSIEARAVFHKRKKEIKDEINSKKLTIDSDEIRIFGYEEENDTIYTIMEYSSNASLERYLQYIDSDGASLPMLSKLVKEDKKRVSISLFIKIFLALIVLLGMVYYLYQFFQKSESVENSKSSVVDEKKLPKLQDREEYVVNKVARAKIIEEPSVEKPMVLKSELNISKVSKVVESIKIDENSSTKTKEENLSKIKKTITSPIDTKIDNNSSIKVNFKSEDNKTELEDNSSTQTPEVAIKIFLDNYIYATATSVKESLKYYDKRVKRYFRFRNIGHKTVANSQKRYNRKWTKRDFKILDFKILKNYKIDNINYYKIKTITVWRVSNSRGKRLSGKSRGIMILKEFKNSFKIVSIYGIK